MSACQAEDRDVKSRRPRHNKSTLHKQESAFILVWLANPLIYSNIRLVDCSQLNRKYLLVV